MIASFISTMVIAVDFAYSRGIPLSPGWICELTKGDSVRETFYCPFIFFSSLPRNLWSQLSNIRDEQVSAVQESRSG
ncbi:hypothetical protein BJX62DRAFT_202822, partial [Aspergillus germanicus]